MKASGLFQAVFMVATVIVMLATFFAISGIGPIEPSGPAIFALLSGNLVLILSLAWMVFGQYRGLRARSSLPGGNRMAKRFAGFFGLAAFLPALLVAAFLGLSVARGLDYWFSEKVRTTVEETAEIARENVDGVIRSLETRVQALAADLNQEGASAALTGQPEQYRAYLQQQAILREFDAIDVVSGDGDVLATSRSTGAVARVPTDDVSEAASGQIALRLADSGMVRALVRLSGYDDAYAAVTVESFAPATLARLRRAEAAILDYRGTLQRSGRVGAVFTIGYAQIAALILLLSVRLGLDAAARITQPIGRLAIAASAVREGDLNARVPVPDGEDEIATLTRAFNEMTLRLKAQREEIESARQDAEDRRAFLEALLSDVNAGVIRTDDALNVTIANPAALALLGIEADLAGLRLGDIAPEFLESARASLTDLQSHDISLDVTRNGVTRHFRVKTSPDRTGGCVLTFDDTTRLVIAQRHLAWRDVARRIAHEIRNPLTPIQLSAERLSRKYRSLAAPDDPTFDKCTDTILRQVSDIGRMVEEFSNFARMPKPTPQRFDLRALLEKVAYSQRMVSPDIHVDLVVEGQAGGPLMAFGDERLLGQALSNVVKNAAEAVGRRPEDDEFEGQIAIHLAADGETIRVAVEDNGPGFPGEDRESLIEPYVTQREGGTGLGLAIVSRIITDHGGTLALRNRADAKRGARVEINLPAEDALLASASGQPAFISSVE